VVAALSTRVYTGTNAGTESSAQTGITLVDADALSGGPVLPGTVSYERWLRLRVDSAPTTGVTNFYVQNTGALPTGVSLKFGVTDDPATPKNTVSLIATMDLTSGRRFIFDTNVYTATGEHSRYLVIQEVVAIGASSGAISQQHLQFGFQES
jgi:hypothetical protein